MFIRGVLLDRTHYLKDTGFNFDCYCFINAVPCHNRNEVVFFSSSFHFSLRSVRITKLAFSWHFPLACANLPSACVNLVNTFDLSPAEEERVNRISLRSIYRWTIDGAWNMNGCEKRLEVGDGYRLTWNPQSACVDDRVDSKGADVYNFLMPISSKTQP